MRVPDFSDAEVVASLTTRGEGHWAGAPSVVRDGDLLRLAWREVHPLGTLSVIHLATSRDGVTLDEVGTIGCRGFHAVSLDRPALVKLDDGSWRLYVSCATARSKHWWIDSLNAESFEALPRGRRRIILPGSADFAVKNPVIRRQGRLWLMWATLHPLGVPEAEDRAATHKFLSRDGIDWDDRGPVLSGREGMWDERAVQVSSVLGLDPLTVTYDGRPSRQTTGRETTGLAVDHGDGRGLVADDALHVDCPVGDGSLRHLDWVDMGDGSIRWYAEMAAPDGSHELVTVLTR